MKKYLIGFLVGAVLFVPASVVAVKALDKRGFPDANDIYQFNCTKRDDGSWIPCNRVAVFDDQGNKCYISYDPNGAQSSISCVRGQ